MPLYIGAFRGKLLRLAGEAFFRKSKEEGNEKVIF